MAVRAEVAAEADASSCAGETAPDIDTVEATSPLAGEATAVLDTDAADHEGTEAVADADIAESGPGWVDTDAALGVDVELSPADLGDGESVGAAIEATAIGEAQVGAEAIDSADGVGPVDAETTDISSASEAIGQPDVAPDCQVGTAVCSGGSLQLCDPSGKWALPKPCPIGTACKLNVCQPVPPCGNGKLDPGEQCDDNNTLALDGCSPQCKWEWNLLYSNDFSAKAPGWTPCAGCSGGGCPSLKGGALVCGGDWTRLCIPMPAYVGFYKRIRFTFVIHGEVPLGAFWIASGPLDDFAAQSPRLMFDAVGGGVTLAGVNVKNVGLLGYLPALPFNTSVGAQIDLQSGEVAVEGPGGVVLPVGKVDKVHEGPWVWNVATNYACCNGLLTQTWLDEFQVWGVFAVP